MFPAWDARTVHVPDETIVSVAPLVPPVVHTAVVWLAKDTAKFDDAVALRLTVFVGWNVWFAGVPNVIVWLAFDTVND